MASSAGLRWWSRKVGRFVRAVNARVSDAERAEVVAWLTSEQRALFEAMPLVDRRHGLDVVAALRRAGWADDRDLLLAGLLHDAGKGAQVRLWHRVAWSLGERYGTWAVRIAGIVPGARSVFERLDRHAELSAELAHASGTPARAVELIRREGDPGDPAAMALQAADEGELP